MSELVDPYCKRHPGAFIEFTGLVTPCCWLVTSEKRYNALKQFMGEDFNRIFITNTKEDIKSAYEKLEQSWTTESPFVTCITVCGKQYVS
jgi:hypothetical protein